MWQRDRRWSQKTRQGEILCVTEHDLTNQMTERRLKWSHVEPCGAQVGTAVAAAAFTHNSIVVNIHGATQDVHNYTSLLQDRNGWLHYCWKSISSKQPGITDIYKHNRALMSRLAISCPFEEQAERNWVECQRNYEAAFKIRIWMSFSKSNFHLIAHETWSILICELCFHLRI